MFDDYQAFVISKTAPKPSNPNLLLLHASMGLSCEYLERSLSHDKENTLEELGDFTFYLAMAYSGKQLRFSLPEFYGKVSGNEIKELTRDLEAFLSLVKREAFYETLEPDIYDSLQTLGATFSRFIAACGFSLEEVILSNMEKLSKRYTSSFTQEESIQRKDKE